jgi:hypothetical protein
MTSVRGGDKYKAVIGELGKKLAAKDVLRVGFLSSARYPDGTYVAMVAAIQNFGAPNNRMFGGPPAPIPPRPFFSNMVADNKKGWPSALAQNLKATDYDVTRSLNLVGEGIEGQLRQSIQDTNSPPLSETTLKMRGVDPGLKFNPKDQATFGAKPLIRSGDMYKSVSHEIKT